MFFCEISNQLFLVLCDVWNTFQYSSSLTHCHPSGAIHWYPVHPSHHSKTHSRTHVSQHSMSHSLVHHSFHSLHWKMSREMPSPAHPALTHSHSDHPS